MKPYTFYDYWSNAKVRGEWSEDTSAGKHWGFFVGDFTKLAWFYCVWLLVRKLALVVFLEMTDGSLNAGASLALQLADTAMLLFLWPFTDAQTTMCEALAGITNALTYISVAVPILSAEWPLLGGADWAGLPDTVEFLIAACGSMIAGISSFFGSIMQLMSTVMVCQGLVPSGPVVDFLAETGAGGLVAGFVADEAIAQATEGGDDKEEEQDEEDEAVQAALASAPAGTSASMQLEMDMKDVEGREEEFKAEVIGDVSVSLKGDPTKMRVLRLAAGSVWAHLQIDDGACPSFPSPAEAARELARQSHDPASPLRMGRHTQHVRRIPIILPADASVHDASVEPGRKGGRGEGGRGQGETTETDEQRALGGHQRQEQVKGGRGRLMSELSFIRMASHYRRATFSTSGRIGLSRDLGAENTKSELQGPRAHGVGGGGADGGPSRRAAGEGERELGGTRAIITTEVSRYVAFEC